MQKPVPLSLQVLPLHIVKYDNNFNLEKDDMLHDQSENPTGILVLPV